jgi:hypothetical protein
MFKFLFVWASISSAIISFRVGKWVPTLGAILKRPNRPDGSISQGIAQLCTTRQHACSRMGTGRLDSWLPWTGMSSLLIARLRPPR